MGQHGNGQIPPNNTPQPYYAKNTQNSYTIPANKNYVPLGFDQHLPQQPTLDPRSGYYPPPLGSYDPRPLGSYDPRTPGYPLNYPPNNMYPNRAVSSNVSYPPNYPPQPNYPSRPQVES